VDRPILDKLAADAPVDDGVVLVGDGHFIGGAELQILVCHVAKPAGHGQRRIAVLAAEVEDVDAVELAQGARRTVAVIDGGKAVEFDEGKKPGKAS